MKEKLIYTVSFLLVFAVVSGTLIFINSMYNNIFKFDFSPIATQTKNENPIQQQKPIADSLKKDSLNAKIDSLAVKPDSVSLAAVAKPDSNKTENKKEIPAKNKIDDNKKAIVQNKIEQPAQLNAAITTQNQPAAVPSLTALAKSKKDSTYSNWVKQTVKLYESMDSRKAAKVIQGYSDNIARDILLKMKKKKAAEILAELKPEVVTRIISVN